MMGAQPQAEAPTQKQKINVYTMMLVIAFICLVTACVLLYQELSLWGAPPWWNTDEGKPASSASVQPADDDLRSLLV